MSKDWYQDIVNFHKEVMGDDFPTKPHQPSFKEISLRITLVREEMEETLDALDRSDMVDLVDGIADSIVVLLGTAVTYGIDIRPIWDEVHRTNMAKKGGTLREDGKRLKPEGWESPRIKEEIQRQLEGG